MSSNSSDTSISVKASSLCVTEDTNSSANMSHVIATGTSVSSTGNTTPMIDKSTDDMFSFSGNIATGYNQLDSLLLSSSSLLNSAQIPPIKKAKKSNDTEEDNLDTIMPPFPPCAQYPNMDANATAYSQVHSSVKMISNWTSYELLLPLMNVIVCVRGGSSYDELYEKVPPNVPTGRTAVYVVSYSALDTIYKCMTGLISSDSELPQKHQDVIRMCKDINAVDYKDIVFYWECCSKCCSNNYSVTTSRYHIGQESVQLIAYLIKVRKMMVMCADFSLKGLIADWDTDMLGPNPFVELGETSTKLSLKFEQQTLLESKSAQLENVGKLSETGTAVIGVMPGTIVYSVVPVTDAPFSTNVLTVTEADAEIPNQCVTVDGKHTGTAGHVMLNFNEGGTLLVSNGHFIELSRLDTSVARLLDVATQEFGYEYSAGLEANLNSLSGAKKNAALQREVSRMVSGAPPCQRSQSQTVQNSLNSGGNKPNRSSTVTEHDNSGVSIDI